MATEYDFVWSAAPASEAPRVFKLCTRCGARQRFRCTDRFRVNASRKLIDVWLLFSCVRCDETVKLPVVERVPTSRIGRSNLRAFEANDRQLAAAAARDVTLLKRAGFSVEVQLPIIDGPVLSAEDVSERTGRSRALVVFRGHETALDRVLAARLPVSRTQAQRLVRSAAVCREPRATPPSGQRAVELVIDWGLVRGVLAQAGISRPRPAKPTR